jgi:hypothetical protein
MIVGCDVPFTVSLTDGLAVSGMADLMFGVGEQKGQVCIEVHDFDAVLPPVPVVRRDLRVVAALHAERTWAGVDCVVLRHLRSGETVSVSRSSGTGRLLTAVVAAAAGIRHRVYVPRLAARSRECLSCAYYGLCVGEQDVLDALDPTLLAEIGAGGTQKD